MDGNGLSAVSLLPFIQRPQAVAVSSSTGKAAGPGPSGESQGDLRATAIPKGSFWRSKRGGEKVGVALRWRRTTVLEISETSQKGINCGYRADLRCQ